MRGEDYKERIAWWPKKKGWESIIERVKGLLMSEWNLKGWKGGGGGGRGGVRAGEGFVNRIFGHLPVDTLQSKEIKLPLRVLEDF